MHGRPEGQQRSLGESQNLGARGQRDEAERRIMEASVSSQGRDPRYLSVHFIPIRLNKKLVLLNLCK